MEDNHLLEERVVRSMQGPINTLNDAFSSRSLKEKPFRIVGNPSLNTQKKLKEQLKHIDKTLFEKAQADGFKLHEKVMSSMSDYLAWRKKFIILDTPYLKLIINPTFFNQPEL